MAFSKGIASISLDDILHNVTEAAILSRYLGIMKIPCVINSPFRKDKNPSFGLYSPDGKRIYYKDFSTGEHGGTFDLLGRMWNCDFKGVLSRISLDIPAFNGGLKACFPTVQNKIHASSLQCKIRDWLPYDLKYWASYGISLKWLKYAEVYPISHKIIVKDGKKYVFAADKYAYAYIEHKEGKVTLKIYQPFNKNGYKWSNKHDASVISLWTKVPVAGDKICICASLKDALCLWVNTGIPSLALQGEGYNISDTAISELKRRYEHIYILFDNDEPGINDARKLAVKTGFVNITLPSFKEGKDISDYYKALNNPVLFKEKMINLFKKKENL